MLLFLTEENSSIVITAHSRMEMSHSLTYCYSDSPLASKTFPRREHLRVLSSAKKHLAEDLPQIQNSIVGHLVILFFCLHNVETKLLVELNSRLIIDLDVEEDG